MACSDMPFGVHSQLASVTRSFTESRIFFSTRPLSSLASNIVKGMNVLCFVEKERKTGEQI